jgi:hypothetical protein
VREKIAGREIDVLAYMAAYDNYFAGKLEDVALDEDEMRRALHGIEGLLLDARSTATTGARPSPTNPSPDCAENEPGQKRVPAPPLLAWTAPTGSNQEGGERAARTHRQRG